MAATIRGRIVDQKSKNPVEEAVITLTITGMTRLVDIAQVTDDTGAFFWNDLTPGKYDILIIAEGYANRKISILLNTNEEQEIFIEL
ncbi:putative membrane protein [Aquimarina sp. EL_43]|uniref:carboxypeptidase-like regulatory domain-containing protein n=1 Tax=Aquimarina TaxID=290174 RepID=UPI000470A595|nr:MULTISPECIES: carboxypeptidase-like regulatory domain-containing protein [Aquimarina]MBG6129535.1 putative membrane protein [Aquimarina sp. EL_35]MBG6150600.1 putative membrane protein [Aquimarina sp. EL_32]MBG6168092.1 putative membrane protein [Aquimarina sp. EL_43]